MSGIAKPIFMLIAMSALAGIIEMAAGERAGRGVRLLTGLCAVACMLSVFLSALDAIR